MSSRERVSLIMTIYNERATVDTFFAGLAGWTRLPDEIVIVDGGSDDGTVELVRRHMASCPVPVHFIEEHRCNIPKGRNIAIRAAQYDIIAGTDMGCVVAKDWLEKIIAPFEADPTVDVVGGYYEPLRELPIHDAYHYLTWRDHLEKGHFLISHRSIAFRRRVWEGVGGYPEHIQAGEDTLFDLRAKKLGFKHAYAPDAKVYWEQKKTYSMFGYLYFRYARGAGRALITPHWYAFFYANYAAMIAWVVLALTISPWFWVVFAAHFGFYSWYRIFRKPLVKQHLALRDILRYFGLTLAIDLGTMIGYPVGVWKWLIRRDEIWVPSRDKRVKSEKSSVG